MMMRRAVRDVVMAVLPGTISVCCLHGVAASGLRHGSNVTLVMTEKARGGLLFVSEDGFDSAVEEASEFEGQWETGVELSCLDGVDGLA